jgi:hypothetical protein
MRILAICVRGLFLCIMIFIQKFGNFEKRLRYAFIVYIIDIKCPPLSVHSVSGR